MDELHTFLFEGKPVRGLFVRLTRGWPALLSRREPGDEHPPAVRELLGQMSAAAVLMHANLRYAGTLILQIFGDGPVKLAVVEVHADLRYRATAKVVGPVDAQATLSAMVNVGGAGRCAITLDPDDKTGGRQPYQGVVDLRAGHDAAGATTIAEVLQHYMRQSEQLATHFVLAADDAGAAGMLVQRLPLEGERNLGGKSSGQVRLPMRTRRSTMPRTSSPRSRPTSCCGSRWRRSCGACSGRKTCASSRHCTRASRAAARGTACARC